MRPVHPPIQKTFVELFCGKAEMSAAFKSLGYITTSIDKRYRKGTCTPDIKIDLLEDVLNITTLENCDVVWASVPCTAFSRASGDKYFKNNVWKKESEIYFKLLFKTMSLIDKIQPVIFYIENPFNRLRKIPEFVNWLHEKNALHYYCTLGSYGFPTTKPTSIFTNNNLLQLNPPINFGRGYKCKNKFSNLTTVNRQKMPIRFAQEIAYYSEIYLNSQF